VNTFILDEKVRKKWRSLRKNFSRLGRITKHLLGISLKGRRGGLKEEGGSKEDGGGSR
jgi:hypothetical protein